MSYKGHIDASEPHIPEYENNVRALIYGFFRENQQQILTRGGGLDV
jgi:hypothetical protein